MVRYLGNQSNYLVLRPACLDLGFVSDSPLLDRSFKFWSLIDQFPGSKFEIGVKYPKFEVQGLKILSPFMQKTPFSLFLFLVAIY